MNTCKKITNKLVTVINNRISSAGKYKVSVCDASGILYFPAEAILLFITVPSLLVISLGGDGTLLRAARVWRMSKTPNGRKKYR